MINNEIVLFTDGETSIEGTVTPDKDTVWLTQKQMEALFDVKQATISEHINNILSSGELDETSIGFSDKSTGGRKPRIYNLDMILSVGYRVNSKKGITFRRWANNVLKQYILQGYAVNERLLSAQGKTIELQSRIIAGSFDVEEAEVLKAVNAYTDALSLLDNYDHQSLTRPEGTEPVYRLCGRSSRPPARRPLSREAGWKNLRRFSIPEHAPNRLWRATPARSSRSICAAVDAGAMALGCGHKTPLRHAVPRRAQPRPRSFRRREPAPGTPRLRPSTCGRSPCLISFVLYMFSLVPFLFTSISQRQRGLEDVGRG